MKLIEIEQNTWQWKEWRDQHICATDASVTMGLKPFGRTPLSLWQEKVSGKSKIKSTPEMEKGKALEPFGREYFTKLTAIDVVPAVIESAEFPWAGASLDGLSYDKKTIVEIKVHRPEIYGKTLTGWYPEYIFPQFQHQLMCAELDWLYYFPFDGTHGHCVKIYRDDEFIKKMIEAEKAFWDCLQNLKAPEECPEDYCVIDDPDASDIMERYLGIREQIAELEKQEKNLKLDLQEIAKDRNIICGLGKMTKIFRKGNIDIGLIPQLVGVDLEPYRRKPSEYYLIKEI